MTEKLTYPACNIFPTQDELKVAQQHGLCADGVTKIAAPYPCSVQIGHHMGQRERMPVVTDSGIAVCVDLGRCVRLCAFGDDD